MIDRDTLDFKKASRPYKICKWQGSSRFFGKVHDKIWGHPSPGKQDWTCLWEGQKCNLTEPFACSRSCSLRLNGCSCQIHKSEPQLSGVSQESSRGWWNTAKPLAFGTAPRPAETNACLITHIYTFLDSPALIIKPTNPQTQRNGFTLICGNTQTHTHTNKTPGRLPTWPAQQSVWFAVESWCVDTSLHASTWVILLIMGVLIVCSLFPGADSRYWVILAARKAESVHNLNSWRKKINNDFSPQRH